MHTNLENKLEQPKKQLEPVQEVLSDKLLQIKKIFNEFKNKNERITEADSSSAQVGFHVLMNQGDTLVSKGNSTTDHESMCMGLGMLTSTLKIAIKRRGREVMTQFKHTGYETVSIDMVQ